MQDIMFSFLSLFIGRASELYSRLYILHVGDAQHDIRPKTNKVKGVMAAV